MTQKCPSFEVSLMERIANFHNIWIYHSTQLMRKKKPYIFFLFILILTMKCSYLTYLQEIKLNKIMQG